MGNKKKDDAGNDKSTHVSGFDTLASLPKHLLLHPTCAWLESNSAVAPPSSPSPLASAPLAGPSASIPAGSGISKFWPASSAENLPANLDVSPQRKQLAVAQNNLLHTSKGRRQLRTLIYREFINRSSTKAKLSPVQRIPDTFTSNSGVESAFSDYLASFKIPLLEETRAQIAGAANFYSNMGPVAICPFRRVAVSQWGARDSNKDKKSTPAKRRAKIRDGCDEDGYPILDESSFDFRSLEQEDVGAVPESMTDYSFVTLKFTGPKEPRLGDILLICELDLSDPSVVERVYTEYEREKAEKARASAAATAETRAADLNVSENPRAASSEHMHAVGGSVGAAADADKIEEFEHSPLVDKVGILRVTRVTGKLRGNGRSNCTFSVTCSVSQMPVPAAPLSHVFVSEPLGTSVPLDRVFESLVDDNVARLGTENLRKAVLDGKFDYAEDVRAASVSGKRVAGLNPSQQKAHDAALATVKHSGICLIQGPPGTGKTKTVCSIITSLLATVFKTNDQQRILQCSPTNTAMIQVAERLVRELKHPDSPVPFDPSMVVVLGHRDKVGDLCATDEFRQFSSEIRVERVARCVAKFADAIERIVGSAPSESGGGGDSSSFSHRENGGFGNEKNRKKKGGRKAQPFQSPAVTCVSSKAPSMPSRAEQIQAANQVENIYLATNEYHQRLKELVGQKIIDFHLPRLEPFKQLCAFMQLLAKLRSSDESPTPSKDESLDSMVIVAAKKLVPVMQSLISFNDSGELERSNPDSLQLFLDLHTLFVSNAQVVFSTLNGTYSSHLKHDNSSFSVVIVDEAGQATEADTTCILRNSVRGLILVGDTKQLQSTIMSDVCATAGFGRSLVERLELLNHKVFMLETQYRMHPRISEFSSSVIYDGWLMDSSWFIAHSGTLHEKDAGGSLINDLEAKLIIKRLREFLAANSSRKLSIGIICPYKAQKFFVQRMVETSLPPHKSEISVNTVDGFQGQERDVIILSLTRVEKVSPFLDDLRRVNVALTRARFNLWVYGDCATYRRSLGKFGGFGWFFNFCDERGYVRRVEALDALMPSYDSAAATEFSEYEEEFYPRGGSRYGKQRNKKKPQAVVRLKTLAETESALLDAWSAAFD